MVKIKILTNQNIPNVTRLYRRIFDPILKGLDGKVHQSIWNDRLNDNGLLLGAYVHCTLVGFVLFFEKEKGTNSVHCWIAGVEETYRKKGVLKSLMRVATKKLKDRGYGAITVTVVNRPVAKVA